MSLCTLCGRWAPPDPETGYDADGLCPTCQADSWTETMNGLMVRSDQAEKYVSRWHDLMVVPLDDDFSDENF